MSNTHPAEAEAKAVAMAAYHFGRSVLAPNPVDSAFFRDRGRLHLLRDRRATRIVEALLSRYPDHIGLRGIIGKIKG
jgi:hypothetical protein